MSIALRLTQEIQSGEGISMDIIFGLWADSGAYPDHGGSERGALGQPVVGPAGLVDILETAVGTGRPPISEVVRIASFQASLEKLDGEYFWSSSFAADPWASTRTLSRPNPSTSSSRIFCASCHRPPTNWL